MRLFNQEPSKGSRTLPRWYAASRARRLSTRFLFAITLLSFGAGVSAAADALYEIKKTEPKVAVGATATASLTIHAKAGWHVNAEAPITVALTPPAGVTLQKAKLTRADLAQSSQESARFDIPVSATEAGKKTISAEARFVLCQEQACKPVKETLVLALDVAPAVAAKEVKKPKRK